MHRLGNGGYGTIPETYSIPKRSFQTNVPPTCFRFLEVAPLSYIDAGKIAIAKRIFVVSAMIPFDSSWKKGILYNVSRLITCIHVRLVSFKGLNSHPEMFAVI